MNVRRELIGFLDGEVPEPLRSYVKAALDSGAPVQYAINVPGPGRRLILSLDNIVYIGE